MPKGGYIIIDFKGVDLAGDNVKIDGIFRAVTNAYKKAVQITGIVIDGVEYPDAFVAIKSSVIEVYGQQLKVSADDTITVTALKGDFTVSAANENIENDIVGFYQNDMVIINTSFHVTDTIPENSKIFQIPEAFTPGQNIDGFIIHPVIGAATHTAYVFADGTVNNFIGGALAEGYYNILITYVRK